MTDKRGDPPRDNGHGVVADEKSAFGSDPELWVERYGDFLFSYALSRVRKPDIAEDLVQETLLAALKAGDSRRSSEGGWLTGILKHKIMDHFRQLNRDRKAGPDDDLPEPLRSRFDEYGHWKRGTDGGPADWGRDAATLMQRKEFMTAFHRCLDKLPPRAADAFVLREMEGLDSESVQEILGVTAANFWVLMHRARLQLRQCIEVNWIRT